MIADSVLDWYVALLQLHIAVIGVVIAGVVALVQLLNGARPRRDIRLLVRSGVLVSYGVLLGVLLVILAMGSWVAAFPEDASRLLGMGWVRFFTDARMAAVVITLSLTTLVWFAYLALKARTLLDSQAYLRTYVSRIPARQVHAYWKAIYAKQPPKAIPLDPFQPIREYIKDNAFQYYDYGTADGLKHFGRLFDKAAKAAPEHSARYISESLAEFFAIFCKTSSEKRKADTIRLLAQKGERLLATDSGRELPVIVRGLEQIAQLSDEDDEVVQVIEHIQQLCDAYLARHPKAKWSEVAPAFETICLSVTRIAETYYLQKNNSLKAVPIISFYTGEHRTVTDALVSFFAAYQDLGDRYVDVHPVQYFEAIESVIEVLFARLADIATTGQQNIGFTMRYHDRARDLYAMYYTFGIDAIEHNKPQLLALALTNLRRIVKPAKQFELEAEHQAIVTLFVELSIKGVAAFGERQLKGERTITMYAHETLAKHATKQLVAEAIAAVEAKHDTDWQHPGVVMLLKKLRTIR